MARKFMKGTEAIAEAAVRSGCRFFAGYPITPQNEIPEYLARRLPEVGGAFVQGESEVASINMVYGSAGTGTRAMTSSSSCGISLMSEGISFCASARLPMVYVNVQRGGPAIGTIQPAQQDYTQATKASGNGGFQMMVFSPATVQEAVDMGVRDAVKFGPILIVNGEPVEALGDGSGLNPRTAIGQRADGAMLLLTIDGRQSNSIGASLADVRDVMLDFGAVNAANLDGGSSTSMIYNGEMINQNASLIGLRKMCTAILVKGGEQQ